MVLPPTKGIQHQEVILAAAKIVGLTIPVQGASPAHGVWAGIAQPRPTVSLPVADDFCQILRKTWDAPSKPCEFNAGLNSPNYLDLFDI